MDKYVYLDNSATTKISPQVLDKMMPYLKENFGNASVSYTLGKISKEAIDKSRKEIANILNVKTQEIYFTTSGTEADNLAVLGFARANKEKGKHIITSSIEHLAIINSCKQLEKEGFDVTYLPVDNFGKVSIDDLEKSIRDDTILISVMTVNNEVGTIQDIKKIAKIAKDHGITFHTDAVQAAPHIRLDTQNVDMMSISGHKFQGPKGVGILYIKSGTNVDNIKFGGHQEKGLIPGTENVANIVGIGEAFKITQNNISQIQEREEILYHYLLSKLKMIPGFELNGNEKDSINSIINFSIDGIDSNELKLYLEVAGICVSAGSACNSGSKKLSHVLKAMKKEKAGIRVSLNYLNTIGQLDYLFLKINQYIKLVQQKKKYLRKI